MGVTACMGLLRGVMIGGGEFIGRGPLRIERPGMDACAYSSPDIYDEMDKQLKYSAA